jgi:hypothetical protein
MPGDQPVALLGRQSLQHPGADLQNQQVLHHPPPSRSAGRGPYHKYVADPPFLTSILGG